MRYTLRSLLRRWKVRFSYLLSRDAGSQRIVDETVRPRLVVLEGKTLPSGTASLLASFNASGNVAGTSATIVDPSANSGLSITRASASASLTFQATSTTVNSRVFADANRNGIIDGGEVGIANAQVQLFDASGTLLGTATSDANGNFSFSSSLGHSSASAVYNTALQVGAMYQLRVQSNAAPAIAVVVSSPAGSTASTTYSSLARGPASASIGGRTFTDDNGNGRFDAGEAGVDNVTVNLLDNGGLTVGTQVTAGGGLYNFAGIAAGTYRVQFDSTTLPVGNIFTTQHAAGSNANNDSDANPANGQSDPIIVATGDTVNNIFAGVYIPVVIGDFVFADANNNGVQDKGEGGQANVVVNLLDTNGKVVSTQTTTGNGLYLFSAAPGSYQVEFLAPAGSNFSAKNQGGNATLDSNADPLTGRTGLVAYTSGDFDVDIDAGVTSAVGGTASIGNFVFFDANQNGIQDATEFGLPNTKVNLLDSKGTFITSTTPDGFGKYSFSGLAAGSYIVEFIPTAAFFAITAKNQGIDPKADSDADPITGRTSVITLTAGEQNGDIDLGLIKPSSAIIGDFVFLDTNNNGIQDAGEAGVSKVTVNLLDGAGIFVTTTSTDTNGKYQFNNVAAGNYQVEFIAPAGFNFGKQDQGANDAIDSDANIVSGRTIVFAVAAGQADMTRDAALVGQPPALSSLGDFVFFDANANGIQDPTEFGVPNQVVNLLDGGGKFIATTKTDSLGKYLFSSLTAGSYIVEVVTSPAGWFFSSPNQGADPKLDSDIISSGNGTGRTGVITLGAGVNNLDVDAGLTKPTTALLGDFVWNDLNCNGIQEAGEPGVANVTVNALDSKGAVFATTKTDSNGKYLFNGLTPGSYSVVFLLPSGFVFTMQNQGADDAVDSDADATTGKSQTVTLLAGQADLTLDAGLCVVAALGDFVWLDNNKNGIQDAGEPGVPNVTVTLFDAKGNSVATQQTDANGKYLFSNLMPATYSVTFTAPAGFTITGQNQGANDLVDSDADTVTGKTGLYTLAPGETNLSVDAGLFLPAPAKLKLGDFVWLDANKNGVQDAGEAGVPNVTVTLFDGSGTNLGTTSTNASGLYLFTNLDPGTYSVTFALPAGFSFTTANAGGNDVIDSDANTVTGSTGNFALASDDLTWDAGLVLIPVNPAVSSIRGKVYHDLNNDGIPQPTEPGIAGAKITLTGTDNLGNPVNRVLFTGPDGTYVFTGLRAGTYQVTETQPPNYIDGKDRAGSQGGVVTNDMVSNIPIPAGVDAVNYDFGERINGGGNGNKEDLLASSGTTPTLASQAGAMPTSPTFGNAVAATRLADPATRRYIVTSGDAGSAPLVRVLDFGTGANRFSFNAYDASFRGGVRTAVGDVTGDGVADIVTAPGAGGGPHIKVFDGVSGALVAQFMAYSVSFTGGVYVAVGDVNGDGTSEIITGAGEGGGAHIRVFTAAGSVVREFFAFDPSFRGGVRVAAGDVNGDGRDDIIAAAGPGGGPHVRVFSGATAQGMLSETFAYDAAFRGGVYVAAGDVNGDGLADVITGAGAGGGPHVRVLSGAGLTQLASFYAYPSNFGGGVRVGSLDVDGDGHSDVLTSPGAGLPAFTRIIDITRGADLENFLSNNPADVGGAFISGGQ